eukprot:TRINITY_DN1465_c0_g1_i1.p1 TRINITY_DN1465_c0_g1~~TRINITY_DN1465_c0_g1_i1.p1  ORF type:complete len:215 (-),score=18.43 TRINITY_DN1465_c0_g1_i1:72-626(-)
MDTQTIVDKLNEKMVVFRVVQVVFSLVSFALAGRELYFFYYIFSQPTAFRIVQVLGFDCFAGVLGFVTSLFLLVTLFFMHNLAHKFVVFAIEVINVIFYFVAFVALAANTGTVSCSAGATNDSTNILLTMCRIFQALTAFLVLTWLVWLSTAIINCMRIFVHKSYDNEGGNRHPSPPSNPPPSA